MGNDQGDVPLSNALRLFSGNASRMGFVLFAFLLLVLPVAATDDLPERCGAGVRSSHDRIHGLKHGTIQAARPLLARFTDSPSKRFRVHFDTTGPDAVDMVDSSANGIPDYIDACIGSLEHAWAVEIDTLGYRQPPEDGTDGGSAALDVYVRNLAPSGFYGMASPDRLISQSPTDRWTSYLEIDNNYSATDSTSNGRPSYTTTGLDALRITCAHEFHHAIQNGSYAFLNLHRMFYELTSTWMEMRCWPQVRDWAFYASAVLNRPSNWPLSRSSGQNGYVWGWFGNVLAALPGNVMRTTWEKIGDRQTPFAALVASCAESGTSLDDAFCIAADALYRTGSRGAGNTILPGAELLPELAVNSTFDVVGSSSTFTGNIAPFEILAFRFNLTSSSGERAAADALLTLNDARIIASDSLRDRFQSYTISITPSPSMLDVPISTTGWGARLQPDAHCLIVAGITLLESGTIFPQPLELAASADLYVPIPGASVGDAVRLSLLDLSMRPVQTTVSSSVSIYQRRLVATLPVNRDVAPGPYLLFVDDGTHPAAMHKIYIR